MKVYPPIVIEAYKVTNGWVNWAYGWLKYNNFSLLKHRGKEFKYNGINYNIEEWSDKNTITIERENKVIFRFQKFKM